MALSKTEKEEKKEKRKLLLAEAADLGLVAGQDFAFTLGIVKLEALLKEKRKSKPKKKPAASSNGSSDPAKTANQGEGAKKKAEAKKKAANRTAEIPIDRPDKDKKLDFSESNTDNQALPDADTDLDLTIGSSDPTNQVNEDAAARSAETPEPAKKESAASVKAAILRGGAAPEAVAVGSESPHAVANEGNAASAPPPASPPPSSPPASPPGSNAAGSDSTPLDNTGQIDALHQMCRSVESAIRGNIKYRNGMMQTKDIKETMATEARNSSVPLESDVNYKQDSTTEAEVVFTALGVAYRIPVNPAEWFAVAS